jgi:hypothetical protein
VLLIDLRLILPRISSAVFLQANGLAGDDAEEDFDHVQARGGWREMHVIRGFLSSQARMLGCLWVA